MLAGTPKAKKKGDDNGCFASALASVRRWGGVLEHPAASHAWRAFGLLAPQRGAWTRCDFVGGWTCEVEQGNYGHRARKATWLYSNLCLAMPSLNWKASSATARIDGGYHSNEERRTKPRVAPAEFLSRAERAATPLPFRDLLLSIARSAERMAA